EWRMSVRQVLAEDPHHGDHIDGPLLLDLDGQTEGADALARLQALLGGQLALDGRYWVPDLSERQLDALRLASPALQADLLALMRRNGTSEADRFAQWFGRWALTASPQTLDGFWHSYPHYQELLARVK